MCLHYVVFMPGAAFVELLRTIAIGFQYLETILRIASRCPPNKQTINYFLNLLFKYLMK